MVENLKHREQPVPRPSVGSVPGLFKDDQYVWNWPTREKAVGENLES